MIKGWKRGNNFIIENDIVKMECIRKGKESIWAIIDLKNYERVKNFSFTWSASYDKTIDDYYIRASVYKDDENGNRIKIPKPLLLHMFLMNPDGNIWIQVDHINHNPKDNRECNLRVTEASKNARNRDGKNSNNKTGYRNVAYIKSDWYKPYWVQIMVDGKNTVLGKFHDVDEAGAFASDMRKKYYGKYKGND